MRLFGNTRQEDRACRREAVAEGLAEQARVQSMGGHHLADRWPLLLSPYNANLQRDAGGGVVPKPCTARRSKVVIYGAGLYRDEAPLDDPSWEVWALNLVAPYDGQRRLRADRWFDVHQRASQTLDDLRWIAVCPVPIYLPEDLQDASPNAVRYPLAAIEHVLGSYFACTFAYQLALILYERVATEVGLYGVELMYGTERERTVEWACLSYWLGRCEERGLRIHLPARSQLGRHVARYGFEYQAELEAVNAYTSKMRAVDSYRRASKDMAGTGG